MTSEQDPTCIFCRIATGDIPMEFVAESATALAFHDSTPQAPTHVLVIPRRHISALRELKPEDGQLAADLLDLARRVADLEGLTANGYRVITNDGPHAGQSVKHLHFHVLGGQQMTGPMV